MTNTSNLRIPRLRPDQILLYETPNGYHGHVSIGDEIRRITLTMMPTSRLTVHDVVATDNGAAIAGTVFQSEQPGGLGKTGKPLPHLNGQITVTGTVDNTFDFAVWRRTAASGQTYYDGLIKPIPEADAPMAAGASSSTLDNVVTLHASQPA